MKWISGKVGFVVTTIAIDGSRYLVAEDRLTNKFRLVNLSYGTVCKEEFDSFNDVLDVLELNEHLIQRTEFQQD